MRAASFRARTELRSRWRPEVSLALLIGIGGGAVLGTFAAARRTESAHPRFVKDYLGAALTVANFPNDQLVPVEAAAGIPGTRAVERFRFAALKVKGEFVTALARSAPAQHADVDRIKVIAGRAANPDEAGEIVATLLGAERGLRLGQEFPLATFGDEPSGDFEAFARAIAAKPLLMRVVGVAASPGGFPPQVSEIAPMAFLTPAFYRGYPNAFADTPDSALIRLDPGTDLETYRAALAKASGGSLVSFLDRRAQDANVQRSLHLQAVAMWILGGLAAVFVALVLIQAALRHVGLEAADHGILASLGMRPSEQVLGTALRLGAVTLAGVALAALLAVAWSRWTPFGTARLAEPAPGMQADLAVLGIGLVALLALVVVTAGVATAASTGRRRSGATERAGVAPGVSRLLPPAPAAGVRFAIDPGRGPSAVPVRTAVTGIAVAAISLVATLTFAASLRHMLDEPSLYGVTWDLTIGADEIGGFDENRRRDLEALPEIDAVSIGNLSLDMLVNGKSVEGMAIEGAIAPPILEGRAPRGTAEIALGPRTLSRLGVRIGDEVTLAPEGGAIEMRMRVVGSALMASGRESSRVGEGGVISVPAFLEVGRRLRIPDFAPGVAFVRLAPGTSIRQAQNAAAALFSPGRKFGTSVYSPPVATPSDIVSFGKVRNLPFVLAGVLGLFAAATLAHTLVTAIRRRRKDLAVMKTLGFVRRQLAVTVAVQGLTMTALALAIAVPLGIVAGRWAWSTFARDLGVIDVPVVPAAAVALTVPAALALTLVIALGPASAAARTRAALVLRAE